MESCGSLNSSRFHSRPHSYYYALQPSYATVSLHYQTKGTKVMKRKTDAETLYPIIEEGYLYRNDEKTLLDFSLSCPHCRTSYHPQFVAWLPDLDEYDGGRYGWTGRGECLVVDLNCESREPGELSFYYDDRDDPCHIGARLLMGNHKGTCEVVILPGNTHYADVVQHRQTGETDD